MVWFALCAASAIKACSELLPDLLLLDLGLSEEDVPAVVRAFSLLNPAGRVIVHTCAAATSQQQGELRVVTPKLSPVLLTTRGLEEMTSAALQRGFQS